MSAAISGLIIAIQSPSSVTFASLNACLAATKILSIVVEVDVMLLAPSVIYSAAADSPNVIPALTHAKALVSIASLN